MPLAREHDPREVVPDRDGDVRERLVVAEPDVERRPVPLDQVLLQMQGLHLAAGDDHFDVGDALGQLRNRVPDVGGGLKVAAYARPQRLGFPDVENLAAAVTKDVDTGLRRQPFELVFEPFLHGLQA
jgi:hypothetical protein